MFLSDFDLSDDANLAYTCECGSVKFCLLKNHQIECYECETKIDMIHLALNDMEASLN